MQTAFLLIAMGFGFKIFADTYTINKRSVKQLGRTVGIIIMAVSLLGTLCTVQNVIQRNMNCPTDGHYGKRGHKGWSSMMQNKMCPLKGDASTESGNPMSTKEFMKYHSFKDMDGGEKPEGGK